MRAGLLVMVVVVCVCACLCHCYTYSIKQCLALERYSMNIYGINDY